MRKEITFEEAQIFITQGNPHVHIDTTIKYYIDEPEKTLYEKRSFDNPGMYYEATIKEALKKLLQDSSDPLLENRAKEIFGKELIE